MYRHEFICENREKNVRKRIMEKTMDKIVQVAKARGFVYPGSEIYGGLANTWDYGNLGVELKNNVKRAWWQKFYSGEPTQRRCRLCYSYESTDLGSFRTSWRILRPSYGL